MDQELKILAINVSSSFLDKDSKTLENWLGLERETVVDFETLKITKIGTFKMMSNKLYFWAKRDSKLLP